ncbi:hypothetical phage protein [Bacillus phage Gamma isolate d'Herelle]|uniref:Distantly related to ECF sigma subunit n=3 Tax=Wbetavirus TaxID=1623308 RepID=Q2I8C0_9CAUD|nr:hypothetical protein [Bacillus anthracis]YP_010739542.1 hypothetical protein P9C59_gp44 [Bacillus phage Gamma]YP_338177.1 hypothetical protein P9C58_gp45 [Bacillus phage Cherry]YP_338230.1 hypothetical protein GAMMAUSAM_0047 [Bacillus phage Gamma]YP_460010.1 hypothetical protein wp46 [Bacillus phage WBeta]YP_512352.1 distantly related to ECF sigma subunit [Bacillus phage Fah]ABC40498.1 hypothetical phage protein [Bacillus phage Gamma isolate d'Herelle]EDX57975.1 hypothetical phage protein
MDVQELSRRLENLEHKVLQVETKADVLNRTAIQKGDKIKVVYPHLGIQGEYLVEKIDNGVLELVAEETMKKIQE